MYGYSIWTSITIICFIRNNYKKRTYEALYQPTIQSAKQNQWANSSPVKDHARVVFDVCEMNVHVALRQQNQHKQYGYFFRDTAAG